MERTGVPRAAPNDGRSPLGRSRVDDRLMWGSDTRTVSLRYTLIHIWWLTGYYLIRHGRWADGMEMEIARGLGRYGGRV